MSESEDSATDAQNKNSIDEDFVPLNHLRRKSRRPTKVIPDVLDKDEEVYDRNDSQIDKIFKRKRKMAESSDEPVSNKMHQVPKARKGRKKTQPRRYVDPSIKLNTIQLNCVSEQKPDIGPTINVDLVCSVCDEVFHDKVKINYHILSMHNGVAKINNKEPFSPTEENDALRLCLRRLKKLQCPKPDCQKSLSTLAGYKNHLQTCGSAEKVVCKECGAKLKPSSLFVHMKNSHTPKLKPIPKAEELAENGVRRSRKAAVKARKSVQLFSSGLMGINSNNNDNDSDGNNPDNETSVIPKGENPEEWMCEQLISRDINLAGVTSVLTEQWKFSIDKNGFVDCPSETCEKKFTTLPGMRYHFQRCGKDMNFTCVECGFKAPKKITVKKHVLTHIRPEEFPPTEEVINTSNTSTTKSSSRASSSKNTPYNCYLFTFLDTFALSHKTMRHLLFDSWFPLPSQWQPLNRSQYEVYLPKAKESVKYKCKNMKHKGRKGKNSARDTDDDDQEWSSLPLFGATGKLGEHTATMFVGGTIRALAWCPTPTGMSLDNEHEQYLAVSADLNFQDIRQPIVTQCNNGPGLIQIWSMSVLSKYGLSTLPKLSFCIAHEFGNVRCLEWCNGGCYTTDDNYEGMERIGLLAAGCSNGYIYVYSVPRPESLSYNAENNVIITRPMPFLQLKPPECNVVSVMSMSWFPAENRNKIVAGFGNGLVCLWDLTTKSQLLWQDISQEFSTLIPYICFMAHYGPVTTVAFCPNTKGEHFCTGSVDKEMKIWSDTNTEHPLTSVKKTIITNCHWSPLACGVFASYDDSYLFKQNRTYYHEAGFHGHPARCLAFHNGCVMGMSFSEWLNTIVTCDYAGEIVATICYQYQEFFRKKKNHRLYKLTPVCRASVERLNEDEINSVNPFSPPITYEKIIEKNGLVFMDAPVHDFSKLPEEESSHVNTADTMNHQPFSHYNLQSVNAVSWNQNCGAHFWLASGFNAGFVRLHCLTGFDNPKLNAYDTSKLEQVIKDQTNYDPSDSTHLNNTTVNSPSNDSIIEQNHNIKIVANEMSDSMDHLNVSTPSTYPEDSHMDSITSDPKDNSDQLPSTRDNEDSQSSASSPNLTLERISPIAQVDS